MVVEGVEQSPRGGGDGGGRRRLLGGELPSDGGKPHRRVFSIHTRFGLCSLLKPHPEKQVRSRVESHNFDRLHHGG